MKGYFDNLPYGWMIGLDEVLWDQYVTNATIADPDEVESEELEALDQVLNRALVWSLLALLVLGALPFGAWIILAM